MRVPGRLASAVVWFVAFLTPLVLSEQILFGQDERRIVSPDGQIAFHLFVAPQEGYALSRIAYQVEYRGNRVIETSYIGVDLWDQEPLLGENDGLISYRADSRQSYHSAVASYMQNGSLGRRIDIEVRAYNEGVAFRYTIGKSAGVQELLIADEATEFALAEKTTVPATSPFVIEQPGLGWLSIAEAKREQFPAMHLAHSEGSIYLTRLERSIADPRIAFAGAAPFTFPWRVISIGPDKKCVQESRLLLKLAQ